MKKQDQVRTVSVDFAGHRRILPAIHEHLGDNLAYFCLVGGTYVNGRTGGSKDMLGPPPFVFSAPHCAAAAIQELGPKAFGEAVAESWHRFLGKVEDTVEVEIRNGIAAARDTFAAMVKDQVDPSVGIVIEP